MLASDARTVARATGIRTSTGSTSRTIYDDVVFRAADAEPDIAQLLANLEQQRLRASTFFAEAVASRGGLPPGRTVQEARDTVWICNAPELYVTLTRQRRWSDRRYVEWSRNTLVQLVINAPVPETAASR